MAAPSFPQFQVVVDDMDGEAPGSMGNHGKSERDQGDSTSSGNVQVASRRSYRMGSDRNDQQNLMVLSENPGDRGHGRGTGCLGRFIKSDFHDHGGERRRKCQTEVSILSPNLKRWRENIRSRFSYGGSRKRKSKMKEDGWDEFLDDTDGSFVIPYQLSTGDNLQASQTAGKMRSESAAPIIPSPAVSGKYAGWKEGTIIVKVKDPGPDGFRGDSYVRKLEENFREPLI